MKGSAEQFPPFTSSVYMWLIGALRVMKGFEYTWFVYTENVPYFVLCLIKTVDKQGQMKAVLVWLSFFRLEILAKSLYVFQILFSLSNFMQGAEYLKWCNFMPFSEG